MFLFKDSKTSILDILSGKWYKMIKIIMIIFWIGGSGCAQNTMIKAPKWGAKFNGHNDVIIDEDVKAKWINQIAIEMKASPSKSNKTTAEPHIVDVPDISQVSYRINGYTEIICVNGDKLLIQNHSSHENDSVGDVTVALDNQFNIFINDGHVCGGIIHFFANGVSIPASSNDFFKRFISDTDDVKWVKYKHIK